MRKLLALALVLLMVVAPMAALAEKPAEPIGQLIVGSITELSGTNFFTSAWGNNAADADIRELIYGYDTIVYTRAGQFEADPTVVKDLSIVVNEDGTKTYTVTINEGLVYNDGTAITVKDYVFNGLFLSNPIFSALGGTTTSGMETVGYEAYNSGETNVFSGLRMLDEYTYSITIKAEELPFYYDITYAGLGPVPMHIIAPGCDVADDGEGAYVTGEFTEELLQKTVNDENEGYRYFPTVSSGPYKFVSFDRGTKVATVEANPLYAGNYAGAKPGIKTVILRKVEEATQIEDLRTGGVDMIQGLSGADGIPPAYDMMEEEAATQGKDVFTYTTYPRAGYGKIAFHCDIGPTQFAEVRQAVAYCLDRPEFARQYSAGYAIVVNSRYGVAQWMYSDNIEEVEAALNPYSYSLENAKNVLIEGGWTLNAEGKDFVEGTDEIRYKKLDDGTLMPCIIKWSDTDNAVAKLLRQMLPENMAAVGMKLEPTVMDFSVMLPEYYGQVENRQYTMFNLGAGFNTADSPWYYYDVDPSLFGGYNSNFIADEVLYTSTQAMKSSATPEEFYEHWFDFVVRFNELLPDIPLYSDDYHDFFTSKLQGYEVTSLYGWTYALLDCWIEE